MLRCSICTSERIRVRCPVYPRKLPQNFAGAVTHCNIIPSRVSGLGFLFLNAHCCPVSVSQS
jgi:hypothetical protein